MINHRYPGLYIAFEGGEGSGKTTQTELLKESLNSLVPREKIFISREPGGTKVSEAIREILLQTRADLGEMDYRTEVLLFAAARNQFLKEVIRPRLLNGEIVITDRCYVSSLAYQGYGRGLGVNYIRKINEDLIRMATPDLIILLDIDPEIGFKRKQPTEFNRLDRETFEFHLKVRQGYLLLAEADLGHILKVDASLSKETQSDQIFNEVKRRFFVDKEPVREINLTSRTGVEF